MFTLNHSYAQRKPAEYIVKDSTYSMGKVVPLDARRIRFQKVKEKPAVYDAREVKEFGYDGKVYESLLINGDQKFLVRIASGAVNLYRDKGLYVLKVDSGLTFFNKKDYRMVIGQSIKCDGSDHSLSKLSYSRAALSNYINAYNLGKCNLDNFPYKKFGGYFGYNFLQFNVTSGNSFNVVESIGAPTVALFYDLPVFKPRSLFLATELNWVHAKPLFYDESQNNTNLLGLNINTVNALINAKWILSQKKVKTYFKAGALISFLNITSTTGLVETVSNGSVIEISREEISKSSTFLYGFNSGAGLEIPYKGRKNFHFELRYLKTFDGSFDSFKMNFSGFSIVAGFNI